jgi:uncharacterized membrane-anchored protein YjiN (DUF445 family)
MSLASSLAPLAKNSIASLAKNFDQETMSALTQNISNPTQNPSDVSDEEKKKAVLAEYCKIIKDNQPAITKLFQESIDNYFYSFQASIENKKKIQDFMFNKIFEIVDKSITADNPAIKSFISAIIKKGTINNILYEPFQKNSIGGLTSSHALENIIQNLQSTITEPKKQSITGGGEEGEEKKVEDVIRFFPLNEDKYTTNDKILDIILLAFEDELKTPKNKLFIYETITQKIEKNIGTVIEGFGDKWFDDEQLVKTVLLNLTNRNFIDNNNNIKSLFLGAIEKFIQWVQNNKQGFLDNGSINYGKLNELLLDAFSLQPIKPEHVQAKLGGGRKNKYRKPKITRKKRTKRRHTKKA